MLMISKTTIPPKTMATLPEIISRRLVRARANGACDEAALTEALLRRGHSFEAIARPKGFRRKRARKQCFMNATVIALGGGADYVEGFAASPGMPITHHAWLTLDGDHAIDQTWERPEACYYFGIVVPKDVLVRALDAQGYYGLFDLPLSDAIRDWLKIERSAI